MKKFISLIIALFTLFSFSLNSIVLAEDIDSSNYKIKDFSVGSEGGQDESSSGYRVMISMGDSVNDERLTSASYRLGIGTSHVWTATAPSIRCFETTTSGSTNCLDADVNPDGMIMTCGEGGCYDRARFELNSENNPSDALYSVEITTDVSWTTFNYIDASTFLIESAVTHDINDYISKSSWEGTVSNLNVLGLTPNTTYYLRATALNGDFTESGSGPVASATTGNSTISFDIDIAGTGGSGSESAAPYSVDIGSITPQVVATASNLIWFDLGTNANNGAIVTVKDTYTGFYSPIFSYTIPSLDTNLNTADEGYGLQNYSSSETYLGPLTPEANFNQSGNTVGRISTTFVNLYNSSLKPLYEGRASVYIKLKANLLAPAGGDYQDEITLIATGIF